MLVASFLGAGALSAPGAASPREAWSAEEVATIESMRLSVLPAPRRDPSNAVEADARAVSLGRRLFLDPRLSRNGRISCASCHDPARQFQDGRPRGLALGLTDRRTMPLADTGRGTWFFWDGRKDSLWSQALGPLEDAREHGGTRLRYVRLLGELYRAEYEAIFGPLPETAGLPPEAGPLGSPAEAAAWNAIDPARRRSISLAFANLGKAIAAWERTLAHAPSRFDAYADAVARGGDPGEARFTTAETNGLRLFLGKGRCASCHTGPLFTDHFFHGTRVPPLDPARPDPGRAAGAIAVQADEFNCLGPFSDASPEACRELRFINAIDPVLRRAFKTPGLRGVAERAPYMHAGQFATLEEVVGHYVKAPEAPAVASRQGHGHAAGSELVPVALGEGEIRDLAAFLRTLSSPVIERAPFAPGDRRPR